MANDQRESHGSKQASSSHVRAIGKRADCSPSSQIPREATGRDAGVVVASRTISIEHNRSKEVSERRSIGGSKSRESRWTAANRGCRNSGWSAPTRWNSVPEESRERILSRGNSNAFLSLFFSFSSFFFFCFLLSLSHRACLLHYEFQAFPGECEERAARTDPSTSPPSIRSACNAKPFV